MTIHPESTPQGTNVRLSPSEGTRKSNGNTLPAKQIRRLLSRAQVAQILGVCPHSIQRLTRRGLLPAIFFNSRTIRYEPEVVETFIQVAKKKTTITPMVSPAHVHGTSTAQDRLNTL